VCSQVTDEIPLVFKCGADDLIGVLHLPVNGGKRGVLIVVGGPQYRVGSHRLFVDVARSLARSGIPVLRFDYRGMGDSDGRYQGFEHINEDIRAAMDAFERNVPGLEDIVLWGLCDAASAVLFYASSDTRVKGIALINPWVRTIAGQARAYLKHYYVQRLLDRDFWRKWMSGNARPLTMIRSLLRVLADAGRSGSDTPPAQLEQGRGPIMPAPASDPAPVPDRMARSLAAFRGPVMIVTSGKDLTAAEFNDLARTSGRWRRLLRNPRLTAHELKECDHTFSREAWQDEVVALTRKWVGTL
jgi:exosortase A-associated hydrolase 1